MNTLLETFTTVKCQVFVIDTGLEKFGEKIYCCISVRNKDDSQNIRFGNKTQIDAMVRTYVRKRA